MRELMLELLTNEPYGEPLPKEKEYIDAILSGNYDPSELDPVLHDLFLGFCDHVQKEDFEDIGWLAQWKAAYGRKHLPLFFERICFYLMVKGDWAESDFMAQIGLKVSRIRKWNISPEFRKNAERDTYSAIRVFRNGVKKQYIVSTVKKLYYEAGRQVQESSKPQKQSMTLSKLPRFVEVFAGTASVAASVVTDGCPFPIVNDYDPTWVCFAFAFTHYQRELRKRIAKFHNDLMSKGTAGLSYNVAYYEKHTPAKSLLRSPKAWDDPRTQWILKELRGFTEDAIADGKSLAQSHQEFIMRTRSGYKDCENDIASCNRANLRNINFNTSTPRSINQLNNILRYAFAQFYCCSFPPDGKNGGIRGVTNVDASSYFSYLKSWAKQNGKEKVMTSIKRKNCAKKARVMMELRLTDSLLLKYDEKSSDQLKKAESASKRAKKSIKEDADSDYKDNKESSRRFSKHLNGADFYCEDFRRIFAKDDSERVYYLDSPYFQTTQYAVGFSDRDHKDMLDILREASFKWIFSMQYNKSEPAPNGTKPKKQLHIADYGTYYRGFYVPFKLDASKRFYIPADDSTEVPKNLFVILFDVEACMKKWDNTNVETAEMLVVNFDCLRTIPLNDTAVVLPFDLFLECADAGDKYSDIVKKAIAWRKDNVTEHYAEGHSV